MSFIDYYAILQVAPDCDEKTLEAAYRLLAKLFHPDRHETADIEKFNQVVEAYRVLRHADQRADYDILYAANVKGENFRPYAADAAPSGDRSALSDGAAHSRILEYLYDSRRKNARNAGVAGFYVQEMLGCSDEEFDFYRWYLLAKGFIETNEQGGLAITVDGVDQVISVSRTVAEKQRLISQSNARPQ